MNKLAPEHPRPESHEFWNLVNIGTKSQQNEGTGQRGLDRHVGRSMEKLSQESMLGHTLMLMISDFNILFDNFVL